MSVFNVRIKKRKQINAFAFLADYLYTRKKHLIFSNQEMSKGGTIYSNTVIHNDTKRRARA